MPGQRPGPLTSAFDEVKREALRRGKTVHESFFIELENYSRHHGVSDRDPEELRKVISRLGIMALGEAKGESGGTVGGKAVRTFLSEECRNPFGTCADVAAKLLEQGWGR